MKEGPDRTPLASRRELATRPTNEESSLDRRTAQRRVIALALVTAAVCGIVFEPFNKGSLVLAITDKHGVDSGDLPFIILLALAAWLARRPR